MATMVNCNYKLDEGGTWLVTDDVWFLTFQFKFFFVRVENRNNLQLFYAFIYKVYFVLFDRESPRSLPKIRLRVSFLDADSPHPCVLIGDVTKAFLQSKSRVEATYAPLFLRMAISTNVKSDEK
jgi:hypothetical protein